MRMFKKVVIIKAKMYVKSLKAFRASQSPLKPVMIDREMAKAGK